MPARFENEEMAVRSDTDGGVQELLRRIRQNPKTNNPRVLVIDQMRQMDAQHHGYPKFMHHDSLSPIQVRNEEEEMELTKNGFRADYKYRAYPKMLFRRNSHPKFQKSAEEKKRIMSMSPEAQRLEMATVNEFDYIEERTINDEATEKKLLAEKPNKATGTGAWCQKVTDIEPFETGPEEDYQVTIARLEGELVALKSGNRKSA